MGFIDSLKEVKEMEKLLHPNVDKSMVNGTFYYDESNNFRKFRLSAKGFNNDVNLQSHFTLGGLYVHKGIKPKVSELVTKLRIQKNQKELKFKFFTYGTSKVEDFLNSRRLKILFDWIGKNDILIHMYSLDYLFISIADIIDDLPDIEKVFQFQRELKGTFYEVVKKNIGNFTDIMCKYKYPNLSIDSKMEFYKEVYNFYIINYEYDIGNPNDILKELLRQMLKAGCKNKGMSFLEDNDELLLHDNFEMMYVNSPMNFTNCVHIFDEEPDIMKGLEELDSNYSKILHMIFKKSEDEIYIQLSDVIAGFSAKLDNLIFNNSAVELVNFVLSLNQFQLDLLDSYIELVKKSEKFCIMFNHLTVPEVYRTKYLILLRTIKERPKENNVQKSKQT